MLEGISSVGDAAGETAARPGVAARPGALFGRCGGPAAKRILPGPSGTKR